MLQSTNVAAGQRQLLPQSIVIQVGQAGNQIGARFWDNIYSEASSSSCLTSNGTSTFFKQVSAEKSLALGYGAGEEDWQHTHRGVGQNQLKARAVLVDMEQGVLGQIASSPNIGHLFDQDSYISSNSGSGNNWGQGYSEYGAEFRDAILESVRRQAEDCDVLDSFFLLSSLGGGTGSGLGSFITQLLAEEFAEVWKFNCCIQPSEKDDSEVIVSPYNSVLSLSKLINYSDCVLAVENQALYDIFAAVEARRTKEVCSNATVSKLLYDGRKRFTSICDNTGRGVGVKSKTKAFDGMNNIVANMLMSLTSSIRFPGQMNVDINDIISNMIPFPKLKFLVSSLSPLVSSSMFLNNSNTNEGSRSNEKSVDQLFSSLYLKDNCLIKCDVKSSTFLATTLISRGNISLADIRRNIDRMRPSLKFVPWNTDGFKIGMCAVPPMDQTNCLLSLSNNTCIVKSMQSMSDRFQMLYRRKANIHHYTKYIEKSLFDESIADVRNLIADYSVA